MSSKAIERFELLTNGIKSEQVVLVKDDKFQNYIACLSIEEEGQNQFIPLAVIPNTTKFEEVPVENHEDHTSE